VEDFFKCAVEAHEQKVVTVAKNEADVKRFVERYGRRPIAVGVFDSLPVFREGFERSAVTLHDDGHSRLLFLEVENRKLRDLAAAPIGLEKNSTFLFVREPIDDDLDRTTHKIVPFNPRFDNPLELPSFLYTNAQPLISELDSKNAKYFGVKHPIFALYLSKTVDPELFRILHAVAQEYRGKFDFAYADFDHSRFFEKLARNNERPLGAGFAIVGFQNARFHKHIYGGAMKLSSVLEWIDFYDSGKLEGKVDHTPKKLVDAETGEVSHHAVHAITGDQWIANVLDGSKDVVVFQYTSNCRPCRRVESLLNTVALQLSHVRSLKFVKVNLDTDSPPKGFRSEKVPSVQFFPANRKSLPEVYHSGKNRGTLLKWIMKYSYFRFSARNRESEIFWARSITFAALWVIFIGLVLRKTRKARLFIARMENVKV